MKEEIKNITEGEAKDMILKYCLDNVGIHSSRDIKENLFPELHLDKVKLLFERMYNSPDQVLTFRGVGREAYISSNGLTDTYLNELGGYTKSENDKKENNLLKLEKENIEFEKSKIDLELSKKMLEEFPKTKWFARIGFIIGIVLMLKELYILIWK